MARILGARVEHLCASRWRRHGGRSPYPISMHGLQLLPSRPLRFAVFPDLQHCRKDYTAPRITLRMMSSLIVSPWAAHAGSIVRTLDRTQKLSTTLISQHGLDSAASSRRGPACGRGIAGLRWPAGPAVRRRRWQPLLHVY